MDLDLTAEQQQVVEALSRASSPAVARPMSFGPASRVASIPSCGRALADLTGPAIGVSRGAGRRRSLAAGPGADQRADRQPSWRRCPSSRERWPPGHWPGPASRGMRASVLLIAEPATVSTVALRPAVDGTARLVPSGAVAGVVVAMDADDLVVVADLPDEQERPNLGCSPLADRSVRVPDRSVLAQGIAAHRAFEQAPRRVASADERRAGRSGGGGPRLGGRLRQGPAPVRRAHRVLPVDRPRSGRCGHPGGRGPPPRPRGGLGARPKTIRTSGRWPRWPSSSPPGPPDGPATWRSTFTAATGSPSSTTSSSTTAGPRRGRSPR